MFSSNSCYCRSRKLLRLDRRRSLSLSISRLHSVSRRRQSDESLAHDASTRSRRTDQSTRRRESTVRRCRSVHLHGENHGLKHRSGRYPHGSFATIDLLHRFVSRLFDLPERERDCRCVCLADIGDLVVLMAKRRYLQHDGSDEPNGTTTRRVVTFNQKLVCHVFESDEVSVEDVDDSPQRTSLGSIDCTFHWTSLSSGVRRVFESERHRRSEFYARYRLSRSTGTTRDGQRRARSILQERMSERGSFSRARIFRVMPRRFSIHRPL